MLGEPHEVEPQPVEPCHLVEDCGIELLMAQPRFGWIAEVVGDPEPQRLSGHDYPRRPDRSRAKRGAVEGPFFSDLQLIVEKRSLHFAPSALRSGRRGECIRPLKA